MHAVDIAPTLFATRAYEPSGREPLGISFCIGDATSLPFEDECFDFATAFMSLMDSVTRAPC